MGAGGFSHRNNRYVNMPESPPRLCPGSWNSFDCRFFFLLLLFRTPISISLDICVLATQLRQHWCNSIYISMVSRSKSPENESSLSPWLQSPLMQLLNGSVGRSTKRHCVASWIDVQYLIHIGRHLRTFLIFCHYKQLSHEQPCI